MKNNKPTLFPAFFAVCFFVLILEGAAVQNSYAQSDCKDKLAKADKALKEGRFRDVRAHAEKVVSNARCERQDMVFALRLISLSFIAEDEADSVRHTVQRILTLKRSFMPDPLDPLMFKQLIEESKEDIAYADAMMVSVASQSVSDLREAPSAVTVFTAEQIQILGVRDLMDLMAFVPGFEVTQDFGNVRNLNIRGNSSGEGKILLLVDGHILNETSFGFAAIGQRFPIYLIERVEIIRGPGSASYGGFAGLAVVSITTKVGGPQQGGQVHTSYEFSGKEKIRQTGDFWLAHQTHNGLRTSISGSFSDAHMTNEAAQSFQGQYINFADSTDIKSQFINADLQYEGIKINLMHEDYRVERTESSSKRTVFGGYYFQIEYEKELTEGLTFTPRLNWKQQEPWNVLEGPGEVEARVNRQWRPGFTLHWQPEESKYYFTLGGEYYTLLSRYNEDSTTYFNETNELSLNSTAFFGEGFYETPWANFTIGARYERHSVVGSAFVPRISITKALGKFHYKVLFNRAFRTPSIFNIDLSDNQEIAPERVRAFEAEFGYKVPQRGNVTVNFFDMKVDDNLVYQETTQIVDGDTLNLSFYDNAGSSGTRGVEIQGHLQLSNKLTFVADYAFYAPNFREVSQFNVATQTKVNQGLSAHKINAYINWQPFSRMVLTPSVMYRSERFSEMINANGDFFTHEESAFVGINFCAEFRNILQHGLHLQFGAYNLLNTFQWNSLAYTTGTNPAPIAGRSVSIRVFYQWKPL